MTTALNALLAERVMGWPVIDIWNDRIPFDGKYVDKDERVAMHREPPVSGKAVPWSPSTDIAAAWEVVEEMQRCFWGYDLWNEGETHWCFFGRKTHDDIESAGEFSGKTPALAICLAALAACGVADDDVRRAMEENA